MADIDSYAVHSGRVLGEDSKVYNIVDLLRSGGGASMEFLFGAGAPAADAGAAGDVYLNTGNGDLYKKTDAWAKIGNLKGAAGAKGDPGPAGKGVKSIALTTTDGAVTGGTVTYTDNTTAAITVTEG